MAGVLVFLQSHQGKILKGSLCALTAAQAVQSKWGRDRICTLTLGAGAAEAAKVALGYGVSLALYSEEAAFHNYLAEAYATAMVEAAKSNNCDTIVLASTSIGKDFLPRVVAAFDGAQASDITAVNDDGSLKRPMFAGNVFADVELCGNFRCISVRTTAFAPASPRSANGEAQALTLSEISSRAQFVSLEVSGGTRPELSDAEVVVSGGRALQSSENFEKYIFPLADALGAAVGASRAAVDSGYAPNDWQVGQTGKVVAPNLYVAVGISGAIQHLAGMKDSKTIVAINKDGDAPIFEVADYGLVADLYQAVPALTEAIKKAKAG